MADLSSNPLPPSYAPYLEPGLVEAAYTSVGRYYLARGVGDGTAIQPYRFVMGGGGWNTGLWGSARLASPEVTQVTDPQWEGNLINNRMTMQLANDKTLVIRCVGPTNPTYHLNEILVYARIYSRLLRMKFPGNSFCKCCFSSWFSVTDQKQVLRLILPL
jgi:hypothetical protein